MSDSIDPIQPNNGSDPDLTRQDPHSFDGNLTKDVFDFWGFNENNFTQLKLKSSAIYTISTNTFIDNILLTSIDLSCNYLEFLCPSLFKGLKNLIFLNLNNNRITHISDFAFKDLTNLNFLNLSSNRLEAIHTNTFSGLVSLTKLDLRDNKIHFVSASVLKNLKKVTPAYCFENNLVKDIFDRNPIIDMGLQINYERMIYFKRSCLLNFK
jgi:Leucine-rich repeat (LRR) protein